MPKVNVPTIEQLKSTNQKFNLNCTEDELREYQELFKGTVQSFNFVDDAVLEPDVYERLKVEVNRYFLCSNLKFKI